ncbi:hypothetical protein Misp02_36790 [Microtetraspora sp. NBRC 16547]|nr:hypothetical protein Misp02_36790 [Microtetraspora sp. NBRC 16547]
MTRVQLTDEEWEFIEPYLPIGGFGPYPERLRRALCCSAAMGSGRLGTGVRSLCG